MSRSIVLSLPIQSDFPEWRLAWFCT